MVKEHVNTETQPQNIKNAKDLQQIFAHSVPNCLICFLLGLLISGASFGGNCFIGGVSLVGAVGAGLHGACALIGICIGYPLLYGFENTLHYIAAGIFVYTIAYLCQFIRMYHSPYFMSFVVMGIVSLIRAFGAVNVVRGNAFPSSELILEIISGGILTYLYGITLRHYSKKYDSTWHLYSLSAIFSTILMSLAPVQICDFISAAKISAVLVYLLIVYYHSKGTSYPIAMMFGLALQYSSSGGEPILFMFFLCSFVDMFPMKHSKIGLCLYLSGVSAALTVLYGPTEELVIQWIENLIAILLFSLVAAKRKPTPHNSLKCVSKPSSNGSDRLYALAALMRDISDASVLKEPDPSQSDIDLNAVIDRAVDEICEHCDKKAICWTNHYVDMVSVFEDAVTNIRQRGKMLDCDLPDYFINHCEGHSALVMAVNYELRRYYNDQRQQQTERDNVRSAARQYMRFAEILEKTAEQLQCKKSMHNTECLQAEIGVASKRKAGETVCGDSFRYFKTDRGMLYMILSDGIGTGPFAEQQSALAVSILEQTLHILDAPSIAIQLANAALYNRNKNKWGYATIDLTAIDLNTGEAAFYKVGAADSYLIKNNTSTVIQGNAYSAGEEPAAEFPTACFTTTLSGDTFLVMASDGADLSAISFPDGHIPNRNNMKLTAKNILLSSNQDASDDKTVIALSLTERTNGPKNSV